MLMIDVSLLFTMALVSVFTTGIVMLLGLTKRNRLQLTLAGILSVFLVMMVMALINIGRSPEHIHYALSSPFRFRFLALGLIAFFATMTYYMMAAHRNLFTLRNGILFLSPVLLTFIVYISWHWGAGVSIDYTYASLSEIWDNRFTVPVILRALMYFFFLIYQGVMIRNMWRLDTMRSKHSILNSPDAVSNIRWLRMVVVGMMAILVMYSLIIFIPSPLILAIYAVVLAVVFIYFIYNALARPMYEETDGWQAVWTLRDGWKIIEGTNKLKLKEAVVGSEAAIPIEKPDYMVLIEQWMKKEKPFCNADFSTADIIAQFPDLNNKLLSELLQKEEGRIQVYIRRHRIEEACRIIIHEKEVKVTELSLRVGFSHISSFSRAFSTVMEETVLQYMSKVGAKRKHENKASKKHILLLLYLIVTTTANCFAQDTIRKIDTTANFMIHFRFDKSIVDYGYMNNASTLKSMHSLLSNREIQNSLDSILIIASSSPEGNARHNSRLAKLRARNLREYLIWKHPEINQFSIRTKSIEENWDGLRDLIITDTCVPHREKAIDIIDSDINTDTKKWRLRQVGGGATWRYIERNILRHLRLAVSYVIFHKTVEVKQPEEPQEDSVEMVSEEDIPEYIPEVVPEPETEPVVKEIEWIRKPLFAIKSNLLYDLGSVLNAEFEIPIGKQWSVSGEYIFPWWQLNSVNWTMQLISGHSAVKYWFGDREHRDVLTGWNLGLYGGAGKYDIQIFDKNGIQGEFFDAGLQLGFAHKIAKVLRMEYSLGLGYMQSDYKKYDKVKDTRYGEIKVFRYPWETHRINWVGPTSAKVSLVWLIHYKTIKR